MDISKLENVANAKLPVSQPQFIEYLQAENARLQAENKALREKLEDLDDEERLRGLGF